jgi:hypothetical protein
MSQGSVSRSQKLPKTRGILLRMSRLPAWFECHDDVSPTRAPNVCSCTMRPLNNMSLGLYASQKKYLLDDTPIGQYVPWTIRPLENMSLGRYVPELFVRIIR